MKKFWDEFKHFVMQGDLVSVAVAFIIGLAFKTLVDSLVNDLLMPIVGIVLGKTSFADLTLTLNDAVIRYGAFITQVFNFAIIAATLFVIVKAYERLRSLRSREEKEADPTELEVLTEIRDLLRERSTG
ncbi:MAG: large conductance mechanosensitive channel protein MscL [Actinobacteria bacterium]|nr:large conductance mechanosensitive channel protein MscL [Actinomycetota bacterium]